MDFYFTIDIDLIDYLAWKESDEMSTAFPQIKSLLEKYPEVKTTWFVRIDSQIEALFGQADYMFHHYADELKWLKDNGHELGWHHHAYKKVNGSWDQNTDEAENVQQLLQYGPLAIRHGLSAARMGWGYHTNRTMKALDEMGFSVDSSAMPRPAYKWERTYKNWETTGDDPYFPSVKDYRVPGETALNILEMPMSVCVLEAPNDTEIVKRYINPAYNHNFFQKAFGKLSGRDYINAIMHPYEILPNTKSHDLLSFNISELEKNIQFLISKSVEFQTISNILSKQHDSQN